MKLLRRFFPIIFVQMQDDLGIAARFELVLTRSLQLPSQLLEVVAFAVVDNVQTAILVGHGLLAPSKVNDRQAAHSKAAYRARKLTIFIGPPMNQALVHLRYDDRQLTS